MKRGFGHFQAIPNLFLYRCLNVLILFKFMAIFSFHAILLLNNFSTRKGEVKEKTEVHIEGKETLDHFKVKLIQIFRPRCVYN